MFMKQITEIKVALAPFNTASKSSRLFLNHVNTNSARKVNPTIKIATDVLSDPAAPSHIQVVYRDGQKIALDSDKMKISNILQVVNKHAKKLEEIEQAKSW
ncbi:hypothetical protein V8B55DRAFT_1477043 [Mucor lusitanicus]|uniref:Large ribosomal subunit protein mL53 n=2 Tax=Mucor circinelloides f. lusitanicus TaxID=29924 RepID=A0A162R3H8_MUCCL|nr:hypothetical protein FB192DRAFT_1376305 [Mucor lusitanicus]OAD07970.1 hypothetical protein MUCCIDRAFT_104918 [Mucor lusitanicus CBS 277.49]